MTVMGVGVTHLHDATSVLLLLGAGISGVVAAGLCVILKRALDEEESRAYEDWDQRKERMISKIERQVLGE
jgi:hypothetical protein